MKDSPLRELRKRRGKSLLDVAKATGYTKGYLSEAERGLTAVGWRARLTLARFYRLPISQVNAICDAIPRT